MKISEVMEFDSYANSVFVVLLLQKSDHSFRENIFPYIRPESLCPNLAQLKATPSPMSQEYS